MPTYSGTNAFTLTIEEVIAESYERCGLFVRSGYDLKTSRRSLNLLFAEWANRGLNLWTIEQRTKTLSAGTSSSSPYAYHSYLQVFYPRHHVPHHSYRPGFSASLPVKGVLIAPFSR